MDSDFHYYGTGTAALASGFNKEDATVIANAAQYVDWFNSDYWSNWYIVNKDGSAVNNNIGSQYKYEYPQLSVQTIGAKMALDYDQNVWNSFHFLPGNLPYSVNDSGWKGLFNSNHKIRKTKLSISDANKLCRPFSKFAFDMIQDTIKNYKALIVAEGDELNALINKLVAPRQRCPVTDGRKLALYFLGVRMHVLSDTWAHQDFTGESNQNINAAGLLNDVYAKDAKGNYQDTTWTQTINFSGDDTDCSAAPRGVGSGACSGHGQMGHYPDYSWLTFKYPAAWLPEGIEHHERSNPKEYNQAWQWINFFMGLCNGTMADGDLPSATPSEIQKVMATWHKLSNVKPEAVFKSETLWKKTLLGNKFPKRWDPQNRTKLGLYDGLATSRFGYVNVVQNSTLHCMETASSMHYKFCVDWLSDNPDYSWVPWQPKT